MNYKLIPLFEGWKYFVWIRITRIWWW